MAPLGMPQRKFCAIIFFYTFQKSQSAGDIGDKIAWLYIQPATEYQNRP